MSMKQLFLFFTLVQLMAMEKLCNAWFMFDELSVVEGDG